LFDLDSLEKYLTSESAQLGVRRVLAVERVPAGLSSLSSRVEVETASGPASWVLRAEPEHGVIPPYDIAREYDLLSRLGPQGLPVPRTVHLEGDPAALGARFMLMEYVPGEVYRSTDPRLAEDPELERTLQRGFVETLAQVHSVADHGVPVPADVPASARELVDVCRMRLEETSLQPRPILTHALDVLDDLAPEGDRLVLLHGDYRLPNLKWHSGRISGILDWELARVGDPHSDIAFTQTVGAGSCAVLGDLAEHYQQLTGFEIDPVRIVYYQALEMAKSAIIGLAAARDLANGGSDLRLISVAGLAATGESVISMLLDQLQSLQEA
jgi:aminoglycoside phosphotransferase (APT) family kinase protein